VTLDNYQTLSTNTLVDTTDDSLDNPQPASIAVWSVEVENTSRSLPFEFVAIALSYITQVQTSTGVINSEWFFDPLAVEEAMTHRDVASNADFSILEAFLDTNSDFTEDESEYIAEFYIFPGFSKKVWLATYIPQGSATRIGYTFRPSDDGSEFPGGNVGIWRTQTNSDDQRCPEGSIAVPPEGLDAIPIPSGEFTLARWPTDSQAITRGFGCTADFTGELGSGCPAGAPWFHNGIDITTPVGSTYYSVIPDLSSVSFAGEDGNGVDCSGIFPDAQPPTTGYGIYIQQSGIVNGRTVSVVGAHLSSTSVITLSAVSDGQSIGRTGNTGCSSSPHLHFSVQVDGVFVDPLTVLP
jgi:murein DD-endopeptidase MepM/ murein hydrolase activator NlpD